VRHNFSNRADVHPSEPPPPSTMARPTTNIHFNKHLSLSLPPPPFNSKTIELLTGYGEVLCTMNGGAIILKVGEQGISLRAEKNFWPPPSLQFTYVGPFTSVQGWLDIYRVGQKKPDHFLKCMTPVYDEVGRRSIYHNVELFIRSKSDIQNVAIFKYSWHKFGETILPQKYHLI